VVTFRELWEHHPTNTGDQYPCQTNGVSNFANQCAIRMGVCLKRAGVLPTQVHGAITCAQAATTGHPADEMHCVRAAELAHALASTSVPGISPYIKLAQPDDFANELNGRTGIIFFNGYWWREEDKARPTGDHIDLWNGWRTSAKVLLPWFGWLGGYDGSGEIWFWEVS
jgi:Type VI secretion system (T6SS), amidase effector protein 4